MIEFQKRYDEDRFKCAFRDPHAVNLKVGDLVTQASHHILQVSFEEDDAGVWSKTTTGSGY